MNMLQSINPIIQALLATIFTWGMTALGAAGVFATREVNQKLLNAMLGFAAGVMIAASYWSLLAPAIEISQSMGVPGWIPAAIGILFGGAFLWGIDKLLPHLHAGLPDGEAEGLAVSCPLRREGFSPFKSFMWGQFSGVVEPLGGVIGAAAVLVMRPFLPYALAFAAGSMLYVVIEELIPEAQRGTSSDLSTIGALLGFVLMMVLDVAFG